MSEEILDKERSLSLVTDTANFKRNSHTFYFGFLTFSAQNASIPALKHQTIQVGTCRP